MVSAFVRVPARACRQNRLTRAGANCGSWAGALTIPLSIREGVAAGIADLAHSEGAAISRSLLRA